MLKTFLSFVMLLALASRCPAQSATPRQPADKGDNAARRDETAAAQHQAAGTSQQREDVERQGAVGTAQQEAVSAAMQEAASVAERKEALLADMRALEAEAKELLKPLDAAAAKAEIAAAAWTLDREWAKQLLRDALVLTFPEEAYRPKLREHAVGAPLSMGPLEDVARGIVRGRILKIAAADPAFARELADTTARELGAVQEVGQYTQLASAAASEGRLDEAGDLIRRAIEAEPTLMEIGSAINAVAARDRAEADRLMLSYIESLRALPLSVFTGQNHTGLRLPISFAIMLRPADYPFFGAPNAAQPAGREVVRAYINFVMDTMSRAQQEHADITRMWAMLAMLGPHVAEQAPELAAQFNELERASRPPGARAPVFNSFADMKKSGDKRYEEQIKTAQETKDPLNLEMAATSAMSRNDFDEARKLLDMLKDERLKAQLAEMADEKEALYLANKGDLAGAERLARQLTRSDSILRAYPSLIRRLAKDKDTASAQFLTYEAVQRLKTSAEKDAANDTYVPSLLAPVASSIRVFKQSRALVALSEMALAVEPVGKQTALDVLDSLVECAGKARITSENGSPNFNADAFARLAAADDGRVRAAATRLEDRLQRIVALAAVYRGDAERLNKKTGGERRPSTPAR